MPVTLANKIAAGEVVQRPASAIKELLENAIDAGAGNLTVVIKGAGSEMIQVVDDGCGMGSRDAVLAFERHATSKIREIEDLDSIRTLGFRGEALASIAAVSQVILKTRRMDDETGTRVEINGGMVESSTPVAAIPGTSVTIRNLFYNVPARRNFLKRPATELKHIVDTVQVMALSNPLVGFRLVNGDNEMFRVSASSRSLPDALSDRFSSVLALDTCGDLIAIEESTSYLSITGFISKPGVYRRTRGHQYLFVNGRYVKHRYLEHAVFSAYEYLLPEGTYPMFALFLEIDPRHVDVNVHPTKAEVKFDDERGIYAMVRTVVRKCLGTSGMMPDFDSATPMSGISLKPSAGSDNDRGGDFSSSRTSSGAGNGDRWREPSGSEWIDRGQQSELLYDADGLLPSGIAGVRSPLESEDDTRDLLWQLHDAYVLTQIRSGLVIVDQHAAHERILYERARQSLRDGFGLSQQLLFPRTAEFAPDDFSLLESLLQDLKALGFDIQFFSGRSVVIQGVPADIHAGDEQSLLDEVLEQYKSFEQVDRLTGKENLARSIARRSAIRPGMRMSKKEMRALIDQLFQCEMPYASPGGRPTIVKLSVEELRERFGLKP
jgi:DNA mismatch repair protein MutL